MTIEEQINYCKERIRNYEKIKIQFELERDYNCVKSVSSKIENLKISLEALLSPKKEEVI